MEPHSMHNATNLLRKLISIPAFSGEEQRRADFLADYFAALRLRSATEGISVERIHNNLIVRQSSFDVSKKTLMLNSHLDTVKPCASYSFDPFNPPFSDTHIYGLGSNDAGASVVAMIETFLRFYDKEMPYNLMLVLSCEEENSGINGMKRVWATIGQSVDFAIIGEPTGMRAAIAERGLLVIDGIATGVSGHAARNEGVNAIYIALEDVLTLKSTKFDKISPTMGEVKLSVTQINAGTQHNVVPDKCTFVVDIRPTEMYDNQELMDILQPKVKSELSARNLTNKSSATPTHHFLMYAVEKLGVETFTSPTTSDWMHVSCPAIKMGPGESTRSHQANEYVLVSELKQGIEGYTHLVENILPV